LLHGKRLWRARQSTSSQIRNRLADGLFVTLGPFFCGLKHIVGNVECRSHASDANASRINLSNGHYSHSLATRPNRADGQFRGEGVLRALDLTFLVTAVTQILLHKAHEPYMLYDLFNADSLAEHSSLPIDRNVLFRVQLGYCRA
jgi:hypothetical protein